MTEHNNNLVLFSGSSNPNLAHRVAKELEKNLSDAYDGRFSDQQLNVRIN